MTTEKELSPIDMLKPINLSSNVEDETQTLTASEIGKLWAAYLGNTMSVQILSYFLQQCEDEHIRTLLENGLVLSKDYMQRIEDFFKKENFPIPIGFTNDDVNLSAPRLYQDEFYAHYLKYVAKAGMSLYSVAIPLAMREDIREFFIYCLNCTTILLGQINKVLIEKKFIPKLPTIPIPNRVDFVHEQNYLNGFVGDVRTLNALEIIHLFDNIENNVTSKTLLLGFYQTCQDKKIKDLFKRGLDMVDKAVKRYMEKLHIEQLETPSFKDHLVTTSTHPPFSDKMMLFHKVDMFSMKIRAFGNSLAVSPRRDLGFLYGRSLKNVLLFVDDGANILIDKGWLESPPQAFDRV